VSLLVRKAAKVEVPICNEDRSRWQMWVTISWVTGLAGLIGIFVAIGMESGALGLIAVVALLAGLFLGPLKATLVTAKRIDPDYVWVRGTGKDYRESLPEFPECR
jgi:O-antigen ligase